MNASPANALVSVVMPVRGVRNTGAGGGFGPVAIGVVCAFAMLVTGLINVVKTARSKLNLENGETERNMFSAYDAIGAFVCLKLSTVNYQAHRVIFAASNKRDKYGFLQFE
mgnify:CR=1 FL=1